MTCIRRRAIYFSKWFLIYIIISSSQQVFAQTSIIEEDREFWNTLIQSIQIQNKNLLYASYIAYKEKLYDLSLESFQECIKQNNDNQIILGIATYYIGKNLYFLGEYNKAINHFISTERYQMENYSYLKAAAYINAAIISFQLNDQPMAKTYLQKALQYDTVNTYSTIVQTLMQKLK